MTDHQWDATTVEDLRAAGGRKWSEFPDCIGAFVAEMDFGAAPEITAALTEALDRGYLGYAPTRAHVELADAVSGWMGREFAWSVDPATVVTVPDVLSALAAVLEKFTPPGSTVIVPTPGYMPFLTIPAALDRTIAQVPMIPRADGGWDYDFEGIETLFAGGAALFVLCNPHNPIGKVATRDELARLAGIATEHGGLVFSDEIHAGLVFDGTHVPFATVSPEAAACSITATSASKAWNLPGLKCAQLIVTREEQLPVLRADEYLLSGGAGLLGIVANTVAYAGDQAWRHDVVAYLDGNRRVLADALAELLPGVAHTMPAATYLAWLDVSALGLPVPGEEFFRTTAKVALVDGKRCGAGFEGHVRLNFATPRPVLLEIVERMSKAVAGLG
jgi:cysteine-S-conjugate beta-lyase